MEDLDKQLEGMKQNVMGLQVWNPDSTSYFQASGGDDKYSYVDGIDPLQVAILLSYKAIVTLSVGLPFAFLTKSINKLIYYLIFISCCHSLTRIRTTSVFIIVRT